MNVVGASLCVPVYFSFLFFPDVLMIMASLLSCYS